MKLNQNTQNILKNFSEINTNILIKPGNELATISTMRNIFAKATVSESFESEFGIYDLNEFLAVVSSLNKPELNLQDKFMNIGLEIKRHYKENYKIAYLKILKNKIDKKD